MPKLEDVQIVEAAHEAAGAEVGVMPEERGGSKPNLAPGRYTFVMPKNVAVLWEVIKNADLGDRLSLDFGQEGIPAYRNGEYVAQWFGRLNALPRNRAKKGEPERQVSDLTFLAVAFGHEAKPYKVGPKGVVEFATAPTQKELAKQIEGLAEQQFLADNEWSSYCNSNKARYISDATGGSVVDPEGTKGCGTRIYQRDLPKGGDGQPLERFPCPKCQAALLAFQNLGRYSKA